MSIEGLVVLTEVFIASLDGVIQPTPHYNSSILEDMAVESTAAVLKESFTGHESTRDAVLLLKVLASLT